MKSFLILLIFLTALSTVLCTVDYCEVEKRLCEGNHKHIGCDKNEIPYSIFNLGKAEKITNELKESILHQINSFRSLVATGNQSPFISASNMRRVTWNNEMEYITTLMVKKLYGQACTSMDAYPLVESMYKQELLNENTPSAKITQIFENIFKDIISKELEYTPEFMRADSRFYSANLTDIGCNFRSLDNFVMTLQCITSIGDSRSIAKAYLTGSPCSNCSMYNQVCSKKYPGLCEDCLCQN